MATQRMTFSDDRITFEAIEIFKRLQRCQWHSKPWHKLHDELHRELKLRPWEDYAVAKPDEKCIYSPDSVGGVWFVASQKLYLALVEAAG